MNNFDTYIVKVFFDEDKENPVESCKGKLEEAISPMLGRIGLYSLISKYNRENEKPSVFAVIVVYDEIDVFSILERLRDWKISIYGANCLCDLS